MKTKCFAKKYRYLPKIESFYRVFVRPIAIQPNDLERQQAHEDDNSPIDHLPTLTVPPILPGDLTKTLQEKEDPGGLYTDVAYTNVQTAIGGTYALNNWKRLVGRTPRPATYVSFGKYGENCVGIGQFYCGAVVDSKWNDSDSISYCSILSTSIGLSTPFNCIVIAVKRGQDWFIVSYNSTRGCHGCGAGDVTQCDIETTKSVTEVAAVLTAVMGSEKTNIQLHPQQPSNENRVFLAGKNIATESQFFAGYYDESYAFFDVAGSGGGIVIQGIFNLLISADPSPDSKSYRDIGNEKQGERDITDLEWLNKMIFAILKKKLSEKIGGHVDCTVTQM
jgi:hypothetical protein